MSDLHQQPLLPVLTEEERLRAAEWLMVNAPKVFRFTTDSSGYFVAVRTLRDGKASV